MRLLKITIFLFLLVACNGQTPPSVVQQASSGEGDYETRIQDDEDRETVMANTAERLSGETCLEQQASHDCKSNCVEIYNRREVQKDCEKLTVAQIQALFELYELLEKPREEVLREQADPEIFDLFLNVSIEGWDHLIKTKYKSRDAEEILLWLMKSEESARVFVKEDRRDYRTFSNLLKKFESFGRGTEYKPFIEKIERKPLMELAINSNDFTVEWFHDFINDRNRDCDREPLSRKCFAIYCQIGKGISKDSRRDWLKLEDMSEYISDIITNKVNSQQGSGSNVVNSNGWIHEDAPGHSYDQIGGKKDIGDWHEDLCQDL